MHRHEPVLPKAFLDLRISPALVKGVAKAGFTDPTEIQREMVPLILSGRDVLGQARTGTGKTAAFGLPILQKLQPEHRLQCLVLAPTRELAIQVGAELNRLAEFSSLRCVVLYGGQKISSQMHRLKRTPQLIVGTPGRLIDMLDRKLIDIRAIDFAVLDEVDRMLDIGFRDDIRNILGRIKKTHQTIFVSATIDESVAKLASQFCQDPVRLDVSRDELTVENVEQWVVTTPPRDKFKCLRCLLQQERPKLAIIFCRTIRMTIRLAKRLHNAEIKAVEIHGDLDQSKRERVMARFRARHFPVLVATDLAARGLDIHDITHIINYDLPDDPEVYVHRIGRTARMGAFGKAISLAGREQGKILTQIEKLTGRQIPQMEVAGFEASESPESAEPPPPGRFQSSVFAAEKSAGPIPKTLGAKFPSPRRRRRR